MVTITNTGKELDSHTKDQAFEPFFTTRAKGTGLGLAIVKKHVGRHGGRVTIENSNGIVQVCVILPLYPPSGIVTDSLGMEGQNPRHAVNEEPCEYGANSNH